MQTLARSATSHVQRCVHCNCVALHVGPVTLRFDAGAAESLWNTLGQALTRLELELDDDVMPAMHMKPQGTA
ncbi:MAG: hypothetical protein ABW352_24325 [Polyangiales bacterium]